MQIILVLSVESAVANVSGVIGNGCGGVRVTVVLVRWRMVSDGHGCDDDQSERSMVLAVVV